MKYPMRELIIKTAQIEEHFKVHPSVSKTAHYLLEIVFKFFCVNSRLKLLVKIHHFFVALLQLCLHIMFFRFLMIIAIFGLSFLCKIPDQKSDHKYKNDHDYHSNTANSSLFFLLFVSQLHVIIHRAQLQAIPPKIQTLIQGLHSVRDEGDA